MCDQCERWVHTECADILTNAPSTSFNCLRCRKIEVPTQPATRRPNASRTAPGKIPERRRTQECNLNNFGFFWQLSPAEMAEDL